MWGLPAESPARPSQALNILGHKSNSKWLLGWVPSQGPCRFPRLRLSTAGGRQPKQSHALCLEAFGDCQVIICLSPDAQKGCDLWQQYNRCLLAVMDWAVQRAPLLPSLPCLLCVPSVAFPAVSGSFAGVNSAESSQCPCQRISHALGEKAAFLASKQPFQSCLPPCARMLWLGAVKVELGGCFGVPEGIGQCALGVVRPGTHCCVMGLSGTSWLQRARSCIKITGQALLLLWTGCVCGMAPSWDERYCSAPLPSWGN